MMRERKEKRKKGGDWASIQLEELPTLVGSAPSHNNSLQGISLSFYSRRKDSLWDTELKMVTSMQITVIRFFLES